MRIMNSRGLRQQLWETPLVTAIHYETVPLMIIFCIHDIINTILTFTQNNEEHNFFIRFTLAVDTCETQTWKLIATTLQQTAYQSYNGVN